MYTCLQSSLAGFQLSLYLKEALKRNKDLQRRVKGLGRWTGDDICFSVCWREDYPYPRRSLLSTPGHEAASVTP